MGHEHLPGHQRTHVLSETQNSSLRELSAGAIQFTVDRLHEALPDLTPNHLTILGVVGVATASTLLTLRKGDASLRDKALTAVSLFSLVGSTIGDGLDGTLARTLKAKNQGDIDSNLGQLLDVLADRTGENAMAFSRAAQAHKKHNRLGVSLALIEAVASSLPSLMRAFDEMRGYKGPEIPPDLFGWAGTRLGRTALGIISTVLPEIHGVPVQELSDALTIISSLLTAAGRLKIGLSNEPATLPPEIRKQAETRFKALALFTGLSLGATIAAYKYLNHHEINPVATQDFSPLPKIEEGKDWYLTVLSSIENYCVQNDLIHRFVGGTVTDLIGIQTTFDIDVEKRTIRLKNQNPPSLQRKDGTTKDVDLVILTPDHEAFIKAKRQFNFWKEQARSKGIPFPMISVEATRYPDWPRRSHIKQFVTAYEVGTDGNFYLTYGDLKQQVEWNTLEGWHFILEDGTFITSRNPYANALSFLLRVPSGLKSKDKATIGVDEKGKYNKFDLVSNLAALTYEAGKQIGIDYELIYQEWVEYTKKLLLHPDLPTKFKRWITGLYWNTIGTRVSHGKLLESLADRFSGI